jgi:hypothetical protein
VALKISDVSCKKGIFWQEQCSVFRIIKVDRGKLSSPEDSPNEGKSIHTANRGADTLGSK